MLLKKSHLVLAVTILIPTIVFLVYLRIVNTSSVDTSPDIAALPDIIVDETKINETKESLYKISREYKILPKAQEILTILPSPEPYDQSDVDNYKTTLQQFENEDLELLAQETIFNETTPNGETFETLILNDQYETLYWQFSDEINNLVLDMNEKYPEQAFYEAFSEVRKIGEVTSAMYGSEIPSIYPSVHAANAYFTCHFMAFIDPENKEYYGKVAEEYGKRGIAFGWYDDDSLLTAKALVAEYLKQTILNNDEAVIIPD